MATQKMYMASSWSTSHTNLREDAASAGPWASAAAKPAKNPKEPKEKTQKQLLEQARFFRTYEQSWLSIS